MEATDDVAEATGEFLRSALVAVRI
jgi:hypothetical protein